MNRLPLTLRKNQDSEKSAFWRRYRRDAILGWIYLIATPVAAIFLGVLNHFVLGSSPIISRSIEILAAVPFCLFAYHFLKFRSATCPRCHESIAKLKNLIFPIDPICPSCGARMDVDENPQDASLINNLAEIDQLLAAEEEHLKALSYLELQKFLTPDSREVQSPLGTQYQITVTSFWEDDSKHGLRVSIVVTGGSVRLIRPALRNFIVSPQGIIIGGGPITIDKRPPDLEKKERKFEPALFVLNQLICFALACLMWDGHTLSFWQAFLLAEIAMIINAFFV